MTDNKMPANTSRLLCHYRVNDQLYRAIVSQTAAADLAQVAPNLLTEKSDEDKLGVCQWVTHRAADELEYSGHFLAILRALVGTADGPRVVAEIDGERLILTPTEAWLERREIDALGGTRWSTSTVITSGHSTYSDANDESISALICSIGAK